MSFHILCPSKATNSLVLTVIITLGMGMINCRQPPIKNPYEVLQMSESSNQQQVKQRFRELSKVYHPDKLKIQNLSDQLLQQSRTKFQQIASAYEFIKTHNFNSRIIRSMYHDDRQPQDYSSRGSYDSSFDSVMDDLSREMFREFGDYRYFEEKAREQERRKEIEGDGAYAMVMDFIRYMIRNKMMTLGAFFVSLGVFSLISCSQSQDKEPYKKSPQQTIARNIATKQ